MKTQEIINSELQMTRFSYKKQINSIQIQTNHISWRRRKRKYLEVDRTVNKGECFNDTNHLTYCDLNERSSSNLQPNLALCNSKNERLVIHDEGDAINVHQSPTTATDSTTNTTTAVRYRGLAVPINMLENNFQLIAVNNEKERTVKIMKQSLIDNKQSKLASNKLNVRDCKKQQQKPKRQAENSPARCRKFSPQINLLPTKHLSLVLSVLFAISLTTISQFSVNCLQVVQNNNINNNNNNRDESLQFHHDHTDQNSPDTLEVVRPHEDTSSGHSSDVIQVTPLLRGQHEYITNEQDLLVQILQSTGSLQEANRLLDTLIKDNLNNRADYSQVKPTLDESPTLTPNLAPPSFQSSANESGTAPNLRVLVPDPLKISDISLVRAKDLNETRGRVGLLDEIIEASAKGSRNANFNVFYDDEQPTVNSTNQNQETKLSLSPNRAAELYKASKQIENLLNPPKPEHSVSSAESGIKEMISNQAAAAAVTTTNKTTKRTNVGDEDGLNNNESISSLIIKAGDHASRRLIANYSHVINHELVLPVDMKLKLERRQQQDAIRILEAPSSLTTPPPSPPSTTTAAREFESQSGETLNNESTMAQSFADVNSVTTSESATTAEPFFKKNNESRIQPERVVAQTNVIGENNSSKQTANSGNKSQQLKISVINNLDNEDNRLRVHKKNESGVHKIVFVNSMPQWVAARTKLPNSMRFTTNNDKEFQDSNGQTTKAMLAENTKIISKSKSKSTSTPKPKILTSTTQSYIELPVFADTFKPTTVPPTEATSTLAPTTELKTTLNDSQGTTQDLSYSIETYETSTTIRKATTSRPKKLPNEKSKHRSQPQRKKNKSNSLSTTKQVKRTNKRGESQGKINGNLINQSRPRGPESTATTAPTTPVTATATTITATSTTIPLSETYEPTMTATPTNPTTMFESQELITPTTPMPTTVTAATTIQEPEKINRDQESSKLRRTAKSLNLAHLLIGIGGMSDRLPIQSLTTTTKAYGGGNTVLSQPLLNALDVADIYNNGQSVKILNNNQQQQQQQQQQQPLPTTYSTLLQTTPYFEIQDTIPVTNDFIPPTPDSLLPSSGIGSEFDSFDDGKRPDKWRAVELPLHSHAAQMKFKKTFIQNQNQNEQTSNDQSDKNNYREVKFDSGEVIRGEQQSLFNKEANQQQVFGLKSKPNIDGQNGKADKEKDKFEGGNSNVLLDLNRLILNNANNNIRRSTVTTSTNSPIFEDATDYSQTQMILPTTSPLPPDLSQTQQPLLDLQITIPGIEQTIPTLATSTKARTTSRPSAVNRPMKPKIRSKAQSIDSLSPFFSENANYSNNNNTNSNSRVPFENIQQQVGSRPIKSLQSSLDNQKVQSEQTRLGQFINHNHQQATTGNSFNFNSTKIKLIDQPTSLLLNNNNDQSFFNRSQSNGNRTLGHFGKRLIDQAQTVEATGGHHLDIGHTGEGFSESKNNNNNNKKRKFSTPTQTSGRQDTITSIPFQTNNLLTNEEPFSVISQNHSSTFDLIKPHHLNLLDKPVQVLKLQQGSPVNSKRGLHTINITAAAAAGEIPGIKKSVFTGEDAITKSGKKEPNNGNDVGKNNIENESEIATTTSATTPTTKTISVDDATTLVSTPSTVNPIRDGTYTEPDSPIRSTTRKPDESVTASNLPYLLDEADETTITAPPKLPTAALEPTLAPITTSKLSPDDPLPSIIFHNRLSSIFQYKLANRTTKANNEANPNINNSISSKQNATLSLALYPFVGYRTKESSTVASGGIPKQKEQNATSVLASTSPSSQSMVLKTSESSTKQLDKNIDILKFIQLNADRANKSIQQQQRIHSNADSGSNSQDGQLNLGFYGDFYKNIDSKNSTFASNNTKVVEDATGSNKRLNNTSGRLFRRERHKSTSPIPGNNSDNVITNSPSSPTAASSVSEDSLTDFVEKGQLKSGLQSKSIASKVKGSNDNGLSEAYQQQQEELRRNKFKGEDQHNNRERSNNSIVDTNSENKLTHQNGDNNNSNSNKFSDSNQEDGQIEGDPTTLTNFAPLATNKQQQRGSRFNEALSRYSTGSRDSELTMAHNLGSGSKEINNNNNSNNNRSGISSPSNSEMSNKSTSVEDNNMKVYVKLLAKDQQKMRDEVRNTMANRWTSGHLRNSSTVSQKKRRREPPVLPPIDAQTTTKLDSSLIGSKQDNQTIRNEQTIGEDSFKPDFSSIEFNRDNLSTLISASELGFQPKNSLGNLFKRLPAHQGQPGESGFLGGAELLPIGYGKLDDQLRADDNVEKEILRQLYERGAIQKKRRELQQNFSSTLDESEKFVDRKFSEPAKEKPYSSLVQPFTEDELPESMLVNDSQNEKSSSLSPLVGEYRTKSLLKTMINLGVPSGGNNPSSLRKGSNEQVRLIKIDKFNRKIPIKQTTSQQQVESANVPTTTELPISTTTQIYSPSTKAEYITTSTLPSTTTTSSMTTLLPGNGQFSPTTPSSAQSRWRTQDGEAQLKPIFFERPNRLNQHQQPARKNTNMLTPTMSPIEPTTTTLNSASFSTPSTSFKPTFSQTDIIQPSTTTLESTTTPTTTTTTASTTAATTTTTMANLQFPHVHYTTPKSALIAQLPYTTTPSTSNTNFGPFNYGNQQQTFGQQMDPIRIILATSNENQRRKETSFGPSSSFDIMQTSADNLNRHSLYQKPKLFVKNNNNQENRFGQLLPSNTTPPPTRFGAYDEGSADSSSNLVDFQQPPSFGITTTNPQVLETVPQITTTTAPAPSTSSSFELENFGLINSTSNYKPPLNYEQSDEQAIIKPFGIRPSNQQRNQRHSVSYHSQGSTTIDGNGAIFNAGNTTFQQTQEFNQLSSFQRIAILTIGVCCTLIVLCLLIIAISIKCRSSFEKSTSSDLSQAKRRKRDEQHRRQLEKRRNFIGNRAAKVAKANNVSASRRIAKIKGKSSSKNNLLLAGDFSTTDGQLCSSAESTTTSACVSSSTSDGVNFINSPQFKQQKVKGTNMSSEFYLKDKKKKKRTRKNETMQKIASSYDNSGNNFFSNRENSRHINGNRNATDPSDQSFGSSLRKKISGTITSRLLRMQLPRLLPYFAFDYATKEQQQQQVNSFLNQQQRLTILNHSNGPSTSEDIYGLNSGNIFTKNGESKAISRDLPPIKMDRQLNQHVSLQKSMMFSGIDQHPITMNHYHQQPIIGQNFHMMRPVVTNTTLAGAIADVKTPKFDGPQQSYTGAGVSLKQQAVNSIQNNHIPEIKARKLLMKKNQLQSNNTNRSTSHSCAQCIPCSGSTWMFTDTNLNNFNNHNHSGANCNHQLAQCSSQQFGVNSSNTTGVAGANVGVNSRGKLPFGTASSVLCQPGQISGVHHHHLDSQLNHTNNHLNSKVPHNQVHKQTSNRLKEAADCQPDALSVQQSQMDNEHHLLIDNAINSSSQQANYFNRATTQKSHNCNQHLIHNNPNLQQQNYSNQHQHQIEGCVGNENEEAKPNYEAKMVNSRLQQQAAARGAFCGITATHFSQLSEESSNSGHEDCAKRNNQDNDELEAGGEAEEEEESETDNYYVLEHNYDGHPTFQLEDTAIDGRLGPTASSNATKNEHPNNRNPHRQQQQQTNLHPQQSTAVCNQRQHVADKAQLTNTMLTSSSKCNCNLVLYPL